MRAGTSRLLLIALALLAFASAMGIAAPLGWPFELFSHFRPQYAVAALLLAAACAALRKPRWALAALVLAMWHGAPVAQRAVAAAPAAACGGTEIRVLTANLLHGNEQRARFTGWLASNPADLVVVQELTPAWAEALEALPEYPHRALVARRDAYGIGVMTRWPLEQVESVDLGDDGRPSLTGVVVVDGRRLRFYGLHARWPVLPSLANSRDLALERVASRVRSESLPTVLLGDLNLSPDSPAFARLLRSSGLRDALAGPHWRPTWLAGFWPLALRIDHVLIGDGLCVEDAEVGESFGSDHRPVSVRLHLPVANPGTPALPVG